MSKTINWPKQYREEVINEPTNKLLCAFRLGRIYYDNHYWVDGEIVDIRVNHRIIRQGQVSGSLKCCPIKDLEPQDFEGQKSNLKSVDQICQFLQETYDQPTTPDTEVTVVYYKNLPLDPEIMDTQDDLHM